MQAGVENGLGPPRDRWHTADEPDQCAFYGYALRPYYGGYGGGYGGPYYGGGYGYGGPSVSFSFGGGGYRGW